MGRIILLVVLGVFMALGMSPALAEEPQLSNQEILKAWGQVQPDVKEVAGVAVLERRGLQPMADENLDEITAAGNFAIITQDFNTIAAIINAQSAVKGGGSVSCHTLVGACFQHVRKMPTDPNTPGTAGF